MTQRTEAGLQVDFRSVPDSQANVPYPVSPPSFYISAKGRALQSQSLFGQCKCCIGECNRVICGGRDVLTGPKLLSNIPHINHFLQGWKRSWALWKVYLSFSEAFQFWVAAGRALREEEISWESKEMPYHIAQLGTVGPGSQIWRQLSKPKDGRTLGWLDSLGRTLYNKITFQPLCVLSFQSNILSQVFIKHLPHGRHHIQY